MTNHSQLSPEAGEQAGWDAFAVTADSNKSMLEHKGGRPADVRHKVRKNFKPSVPAEISVLPKDEIYHGLKDLGPVLGDGGPTIERKAKAAVPVVEESVRVIPVETPAEEPANIPVNLRLA